MAGAVVDTAANAENVRLPKTVKPLFYDIYFVPQFETVTFKRNETTNEILEVIMAFWGREVIFVEILEETQELVLNVKELELNSARVSGFNPGGGKFDFVARQIDVDTERQRATLRFERQLPKGRLFLGVHFKGMLKNDMAGCYLSAYKTPEGEEKVMIVTQFEDSDARKAFPCWDEPALKAKFRLTLEIPENMDALSNTEPSDIFRSPGGEKIVTFGQTPLMSTYLLAFAIGEFESIEDITDNGVKVRVFTTRGHKEKGRFALEVGKKCLEFYDDFYGIPYSGSLPKLDMLAIPNFAAGAMENWGLVTFRVNALLIDPKNSSSATKQRVAIVVAHEINHMWFGNLVTMEWWTQLWLNEGLTSFMEYLAVDHIFPEWKIWEHFMSMDYASALSADGLRTTHPIEVPINHPSEITQNFDAISYSKGACVIRMIYSQLGSEKFREGMRLYMQRHKYGNTVTEDLWQAFEDASGMSIRSMMDTWTKQPGYPVIKMEENDSAAPHSGLEKYQMYQIKQERFLSSGEALTEEENKQVWKIPMDVVYKYKDCERRFQLTERSKEHPWVVPGGFEWVKFNTDHTAFARVCYPQKLREALRGALQEGKLSVFDRFGIVNDLCAFAKAGILPTSQLLAMFEAYKNEKELIVWQQIVGAMNSVEIILPDKETKYIFECFAKNILLTIANKAGWKAGENETHNDSLLRPMVLSAIGSYGYRLTVERAIGLFLRYIEDLKPIDPNLRSVVYGLSASWGTPFVFEKLVKIYKESDLSEEKVRVLGAIGLFEDEELARKALEFALSGEVKNQDIFYVFSSVGMNRKYNKLAWQFVKDNWQELCRRLGGAAMLLGRIVEGATARFITEEDARDLEEFFRANPIPEINKTISQTVERIRSRASWLKRDAESVRRWLQEWAAANQ